MSSLVCFFFFKQKTAYEMRISDWSSDVCSSDLAVVEPGALPAQRPAARLAGDVVGAVARDEDMRLGLERQDAGVFEEDERLANRFAGHGPVLGRAEQLVAARVSARRRLARVEQAPALLDAPDATHGGGEPTHAERAGLPLGAGASG